MSATFFCTVQSLYTVQEFYDEMQADTLAKYQGKDLVLSGMSPVVTFMNKKEIIFNFIFLLHNHRSRRTNIAHSAHLDRGTTTARHVCVC